MKKTYSAFLLPLILLWGFAIHAQTPYHKMIASNYTDWYIFQDYIPVKPAGGSAVNTFNLSEGKYSATNDTFLLGNTYKKMAHLYFNPGVNQNNLIGFIREDTIARKVYFLEKNAPSEIVLYDFSITQGSIAVLNFPDNSGDFPAGSYAVTKVDSVLTRVGYRKQFKLVSPSSDTLIYIESIGSIIHPLYLYQSYYGPGMFSFGGSSTCSYPYGLGLACKYSNNEKYFQSCTYVLAEMNNCIYKYDSCNYYTSCSGIKENISRINLKVTPNPTSENINLEIESANEEVITIDLYDVSGRKLKTLFNGKTLPGKNTITMDLTDYQSGYYFMKITGKDYIENSPVIIAR